MMMTANADYIVFRQCAVGTW